jgi:AcrR family transcriptional regulator
MPRIKAATVPEHREAQRAAILDAAREVILGKGLTALTFGDLADRTGLARPSVYEYFRTKSALVTALVEEEAPKWQADVSAAMADSRSKEDAIAAFVRAILELVKAGRHELPFALAAGDLDAGARESMNKAHQGLFMLIVPTLKEMGVRDAVSCVEMIGGVVTAAGQALRHDKKRRGLVDLAVGFAVGGVRACARRG